MKYAKKECCRCHAVLAANEMICRTEEVEAGRSSGAWGLRKGFSTGIGSERRNPKRTRTSASVTYSAGRTYYKSVDCWYCNPCMQELQAAQAMRRKRIFWIGSVVVVLFASIWSADKVANYIRVQTSGATAPATESAATRLTPENLQTNPGDSGASENGGPSTPRGATESSSRPLTGQGSGTSEGADPRPEAGGPRTGREDASPHQQGVVPTGPSVPPKQNKSFDDAIYRGA